jgi:hypothetical protein
LTDFKLLARFERTFRDGPYLHRNSQLGNRIADYLFDDLYELDPGSRLRSDVDSGRVALNPKGISPGLKARRGDGSFGPIVPGHSPRPFPGHSIPVGPTAEVDIGAEVKILAKAMIKQIDRVTSDLCGQAAHFKKKSPDALAVGIVGLNLADEYVSYEGDRQYPTGQYGPHPAQEAPGNDRALDRPDPRTATGRRQQPRRGIKAVARGSPRAGRSVRRLHRRRPRHRGHAAAGSRPRVHHPLAVDRFEEFFALLPSRGDSDHSWTLTREAIEARNFDLKAVNPNAKSTEDTRTPEELLDIIEAQGREVDAAIAELRRLLAEV